MSRPIDARTRFTLTCLVAALTLSVVAAGACPTALNVMPTADVMSEGRLNIQTEVSGDAAHLTDDTGWSLFTEVGLTRQVEVGADLVDIGGDSDWVLDAKWQLIVETSSRPAIAIGVLGVNRGADRGYYAAAAESFGSGGARFHAGILHTRTTTAGMIGAEAQIAPETAILADWITGPDGLTGWGINRALTGGYDLRVFYLDSNSGEADDTLGLNLCWEGEWWRP